MDAPATADIRQTRTPPYVSFSTFKTCVADLKEHGIPNKIDRSVLTRFSGITGTQLMTALKFLNLMDHSGRPTPHLTELVHAHGTSDWPQKLHAVLQPPYAPIFAINLETATPNEFSQTFAKAFPGAESVIRRCVAFFLPAAADAGVQISKRILTGRKPRNPNGSPRKRSTAKLSPDPAAGAAQENNNLKGKDQLTATNDEFKAQLLAKFPTFDPQWPNDIKTEWFKGFQQFMGLTQKDGQ